MAVKPMHFEIGASLRADRLLVQANYLAGLATGEEASIAAHGWPSPRTGYLLTRAVELKEAMRILGRDVVLPEMLTAHRYVHQAREWGQQTILYLQNTLEDQHPVLDNLRTPPPLPLLGHTLKWLTPLVELARYYEQELSSWGGGSEFVFQGEHIRDHLREAVSRGLLSRQLSSSEERVLELKSELYLSLCRLVRCGRALWIDDDLAARAYHLHYLDTRTPVPAELEIAGTGMAAGFQLADLGRPERETERLEADLKVETLAAAPVTPMGQEDVPLVASGWYNEPEHFKGGQATTRAMQGEREQEPRGLKGMSVGTDWGIHRDPEARSPERETSPRPAGQHRPEEPREPAHKDSDEEALKRKGGSSERWGEPTPRGAGRT